MTVIAHVAIGGVGSLIGDLLISGDAPTQAVHLPATRDINVRLPFATNRFVVGLQQKIVQIGPRIVFAWSGQFTQAENFYSLIEPLKFMRNIDQRFVEDVISNIEESHRSRLSLIGMVMQDGRYDLFGHGTEPPQSFGQANHVITAGTGGSAFRTIIEQHANNLNSLHPTASSDDIARSFDLNLAGALQSVEFSSPAGLLQGWGGGFEIARATSVGIQKIDNVLFLHFFLIDNASDDLDLWWLPDLRHTSLSGEYTVVQAIEHSVSPERVLPGRRDIFVVNAPGRPAADPNQLIPPDVRIQNVVMVSIEHQASGDVITVPSYGGSSAIKYEAIPGTTDVLLELDSEFVAGAATIAEQRWRRTVTFRGLANRETVGL